MLDLLFPRQCPCGEWDEAVCDACLEYLSNPRDVTAQCPGLDPLLGPVCPAWAMSDYLGPIGPVIRAWKNRADIELTRRISTRVSDLISHWDPPFPPDIIVVPAPSSPARYKADTFIAGHLADAVARGLARGGRDTVSAEIIAPRRGHQKGRGRTERSRRQPMRALPGSGHVLVVDDVVTTGATLAHCFGALEASGYTLLGAVCMSSARGWTNMEEDVI